jgi:hypothetical protein
LSFGFHTRLFGILRYFNVAFADESHFKLLKKIGLADANHMPNDPNCADFVNCGSGENTKKCLHLNNKLIDYNKSALLVVRDPRTNNIDLQKSGIPLVCKKPGVGAQKIRERLEMVVDRNNNGFGRSMGGNMLPRHSGHAGHLNTRSRNHLNTNVNHRNLNAQQSTNSNSDGGSGGHSGVFAGANSGSGEYGGLLGGDASRPWAGHGGLGESPGTPAVGSAVFPASKSAIEANKNGVLSRKSLLPPGQMAPGQLLNCDPQFNGIEGMHNAAGSPGTASNSVSVESSSGSGAGNSNSMNSSGESHSGSSSSSPSGSNSGSSSGNNTASDAADNDFHSVMGGINLDRLNVDDNEFHSELNFEIIMKLMWSGSMWTKREGVS